MLNNTKKLVVSIMALLLFIFCISLLCFISLSYEISGTYTDGYEPSSHSITLVLKEENFTIYNSKEVLERGTIYKCNLNTKVDIYKLVSNENIVAYLICEKKKIVLLGYKDLAVRLKK